MSQLTCTEDVTRKGESQPCDKTAVAYRVDPTERTPYPVCAFHCRGEMVPLSNVIEYFRRLWRAGLDVTE